MDGGVGPGRKRRRARGGAAARGTRQCQGAGPDDPHHPPNPPLPAHRAIMRPYSCARASSGSSSPAASIACSAPACCCSAASAASTRAWCCASWIAACAACFQTGSERSGSKQRRGLDDC
jgi:hypothetical protein